MRASASDFDFSGPLVTNQDAFICGKPQILESPLIVNVSAWIFAAKLGARGVINPKSRNTSSAIIAMFRDEQISLSCLMSFTPAKWPVGLLGFTTTTARLRGVMTFPRA